MASSTPQKYIELAKTLPPRLLRFFQRYPPPEETLAVPLPGPKPWPPPPPPQLSYHNPFLPRFNTVTQRWQGPVFSLRRQAELCKMAVRYGVEDLLPYSRKKPSERRKRANLREVETGVDGRKVKGHAWERGLKSKLDKRREAMMNMPAMIQEWKLRGHGKGWTKWPK
ncbi:mitochondrial 54S ribosomal protein mL59 [Phyllosticta citribraziliensis]|uniref:Large ribosomal subunit protein mL59 domain-containing protein n=1 Tax=Phyllosticta citribraziliensis TaxID=989973 RepID=A0ABR1M4M9_9PEZI